MLKQNNNRIASVQIKNVIYNRYLMNKQIKIFFLLLFTIISNTFASVDSLYEIDGSAFNERNKTKGPKALVKVERHKGNENSFKVKPTSANIPVQDTFRISLKKGAEQWIEMEKNTDYFVCVDDSKGGFWKIKNLSYTKESENCIRLNSGNFVKSGKIQYATRMGNGYTFHLLVGMKYIDLRGQKHLLGYNKEYKFTH